MRNEYVNQLGLEIRKASFIQFQGVTFDIIVSGSAIYTSFNAGDAKQFCIDNRLSARIVN